MWHLGKLDYVTKFMRHIVCYESEKKGTRSFVLLNPPSNPISRARSTTYCTAHLQTSIRPISYNSIQRIGLHTMEPEGDLQEPTYLTDDEARNIANSFYTSLHARYFSREDCYQNAAKLKDLYDKVVRTVRLCNDLCLSALKVCSDLKVLERSFKGDGTMIIKAGWCLAPAAEDPQIPKDMDDKTSLIAVCFQACVRAIEILSPLVAYLLSPAGIFDMPCSKLGTADEGNR